MEQDNETLNKSIIFRFIIFISLDVCILLDNVSAKNITKVVSYASVERK